jgi:hypothetical protein
MRGVSPWLNRHPSIVDSGSHRRNSAGAPHPDRLVVPRGPHYIAGSAAKRRGPRSTQPTPMITPTTRLVRDPALISASLGEEIAMLHVESGRYYFLNGVAAAVWEHLEAATTPAAICASLVAQYEVSPGQCESEVLSLLDTLLEKEMIRIAR